MMNVVDLQKILDFISSSDLKTMVCTNDDKQYGWNNWLTIPVPGYLDFGLEPIPFYEVKSIYVQSFYEKITGTRIPPKRVSVLDELETLLKDSRCIEFWKRSDEEDIIIISFIPTHSTDM